MISFAVAEIVTARPRTLRGALLVNHLHDDHLHVFSASRLLLEKCCRGLNKVALRETRRRLAINTYEETTLTCSAAQCYRHYCVYPVHEQLGGLTFSARGKGIEHDVVRTR